jgi:hypothetical protein
VISLAWYLINVLVAVKKNTGSVHAMLSLVVVLIFKVCCDGNKACSLVHGRLERSLLVITSWSGMYESTKVSSFIDVSTVLRS